MRTKNTVYDQRMARKDQRVAQWQAQIERLQGLVEKAISVLESDLDNPTDARLRQAAAIHVLKAVKLYGDVDRPEDEYIPKFTL